MKIAVFSLLVVLSSFDIAQGNGMHNIHWNATNPLFNPRVSENIIQVNGGNHPSEYDQVNIVCPFYKSIEEAKNAEKYIIYSVTQQEHDSCRISEANPRIIAVCDRPHELMYFTITFRSFTPTPGGLEFRPGHSYYFISTSSKNGLHRRVGGGCSTHNMKITFRVAAEDAIPSRVNKEAEVNLQPPSLVSSTASEADMLSKETFYYPTSEVEKAGFYHHKQSHQEAQAPWLQSSASTTAASLRSVDSVQFLIAISVLYQWAVNFWI